MMNKTIFAALCLLTLFACSDNNDNVAITPQPPVMPQPPTPPTMPPEPPGPGTSAFMQETRDLDSKAQPAFTPGSPGVTVMNGKLLTQFGDREINFNKARYTRYYLEENATRTPDAILVLIPGFQGGASGFYVLAEELLRKGLVENNLSLEVWAFDRRSSFLEDTIGLDLAEEQRDPALGLNFLFGEALGLDLGDALTAGPNRRAVFYNSNSDTAFMSQWTTLVHSQDIDALVEAAHTAVLGGNVFLGGHSAGTGYTARYAATDFDLADDAIEPGHAKLRGLMLFEGGGSRLASEPADDATLDLIEASFDGGLYGAIRDQAARCIDGATACSAESAATDCAAFTNTSCVQPRGAFSEVAGLLSPQLLAISEVNALDAEEVGDGVLSILLTDQNGIEGNNAIAQVPELSILTPLVGNTPASSAALLGKFLDDDGVAAQVASFVATSLGADGPVIDGIATWLSKGEDIPQSAFVDNGPAPTALDDIGVWGVEAEPSDLEGRMLPSFYRGQTNFSEWYYPSSGLAVTSGLGLDTTELSAPPPLGRGRSDIENRTEADGIDIPIIAFGGSNGLTPVPAVWLGFADAIAPCAAPSCDGMTARVIDRENPSPAFPTFGDSAGGFEVYMSEGYAHVDILTADDDTSNNVIDPLLAFIQRNVQ